MELLLTVDRAWSNTVSTNSSDLLSPEAVSRRLRSSMSVIHEASKVLPPAKIVSFLHDTILHHVPPAFQSVDLHDTYVRFLCKEDVDAALTHVQTMENQKTLPPNICTYAYVVDALSKAGRHAEVIVLLDMNLGRNLNRHINVSNNVDGRQYHLDVSWQLKAKRKIRIAAELARQSSEPSLDDLTKREMFRKDMWSLKRNPEEREVAWDLLETLGSAADMSHLCSVLIHQEKYLTDRSSTISRDTLLQESNGFIFALDAMTEKDVIKNAWWSTQVSRCLAFLTLSDGSALSVDTEMCNILLRGCALSRDSTTARMVWRDVMNGGSTKDDAKDSTKDSAKDSAKDSTKDSAKDAGGAKKDNAATFERIQPDAHTRHYLINSVLRSFGTTKELRSCWNTMPEISPLTMTVNLVMHRIMQRSGVPSGLAMLNSQLVRHNIQPDISTLNILLRGCARGGHVGAACSLLEGARDMWNVAPDVISYTTLMQCYRADKDPVGAYAAFQSIVRNGLTPDNVACSRIVQLFAEFGEEDACMHILEEALEKEWIDNKTMMQLEEMVADIAEAEEENQDEEEDEDKEEDEDEFAFEEEENQMEEGEVVLEEGEDEMFGTRVVFRNSLIPLPGAETEGYHPDKWLLDEMELLTPGSVKSCSLIEERSVVGARNNSLRVWIDENEVRVLDLSNKSGV